MMPHPWFGDQRRQLVAKARSARSPVVSKSGKAWANGKITSKDHFSHARAAAKQAARIDVASRLNGKKAAK